MKRKLFFMVVALLALYVTLHVIVLRKDNVAKVAKQSAVIEFKLRENQAQKLILIEEKRKMETALGSIPKAILEGFADPERQFVDFVDYINGSELKKMQGSMAISQLQTFKAQPVPLQEAQFEFEFNIASTQQLDRFLDYLLFKGKYPLTVQRIEITRIPQQYPHVFVKVALLLPDKIDLPQFTTTGKEAS